MLSQANTPTLRSTPFPTFVSRLVKSHLVFLCKSNALYSKKLIYRAQLSNIVMDIYFLGTSTKFGKQSLRSVLLCLFEACSRRLGKSLVPAVGGYEECDIRRRAGSFEEGSFADGTLDVHGFLVSLELRFGDDLIISFAVALRCCFGSL